MSERKETGRAYWKSLEEQANTPEFRARVEREFPALAMELEKAPPGPSRRRFLQLVGASLALAGVGGIGGCRRDDHRLMPYQHKSAEQVPGNAIYYATTFVMAGVPMGVLVKTVDGRPIKIEGNPNHPNSGGATNAWAQASILDLYDPDRSKVPLKDGKPVRMKEDVLPFLDNLAKELKATKGKGLLVLCEDVGSPAMAMLQQHFQSQLPESRWETCEGPSHGYPAAEEIAEAEVIVSLDCDFLGAEDHGVAYKRAFAASRGTDGPAKKMSRLYVAEASFTVTGAAADHRLTLPASAMAELAILLTQEILPVDLLEDSVKKYVPWAGIDPRWIKAMAADLRSAGKRGLVLIGQRYQRSSRVARKLKEALYGPIPGRITMERNPKLSLDDFAPTYQNPLRTLSDGDRPVTTLLVVGANPAYTGAGQDLQARLMQIPLTIHLGQSVDETAEACKWHIPVSHYLESWGDASDVDAYSLIQPAVEPLFGTQSALELVARIGGYRTTSGYDIIREIFRRMSVDEMDWRRCLNEGRSAKTYGAQDESWGFYSPVSESARARGQGSAENLEICFAIDPKVFDGRFANNGWLQEMPDPITNLTWDNAAIISPRLAKEKSLATGDVVTISVNGKSIEAPVMVLPGQADWSITLPLGYGRTRAGSLGTGVGFNAYKLRTSDSPGFALGATIEKTGKTYPLATTQEHWSIAEHHIVDEQLKKRAIVREGTLEEYRKEPLFAKHMGEAHAPTKDDIYRNPLEGFKKDGSLHQWAMAIDLSACVGCGACVIACQAENNVPIVGKDEVIRGREMHWIRIDRYFSGDPSPDSAVGFAVRTEDGAQSAPYAEYSPVRVNYQPMLCQHCEAAPCEPVCPVNATVHDSEGLNAMVYNRCIGTRYCSNNCPYKVRRFNYFDWNKGTIRESGKAPFDGQIQPDPRKGFSLPQIAQPPMQELLKMQKNPDVTVRMRGVMEKCTFCVQRIESAKIAQRSAAGDKPPAKVPDGTIQTACQQSCPTQAIIFGDGSDPNSRVSKLRASARSYDVLDHLNTKPRIGYLARITNPNPALAAPLAGRVEQGDASDTLTRPASGAAKDENMTEARHE